MTVSRTGGAAHPARVPENNAYGSYLRAAAPVIHRSYYNSVCQSLSLSSNVAEAEEPWRGSCSASTPAVLDFCPTSHAQWTTDRVSVSTRSPVTIIMT